LSEGKDDGSGRGGGERPRGGSACRRASTLRSKISLKRGHSSRWTCSRYWSRRRPPPAPAPRWGFGECEAEGGRGCRGWTASQKHELVAILHLRGGGVVRTPVLLRNSKSNTPPPSHRSLDPQSERMGSDAGRRGSSTSTEPMGFSSNAVRCGGRTDITVRPPVVKKIGGGEWRGARRGRRPPP